MSGAPRPWGTLPKQLASSRRPPRLVIDLFDQRHISNQLALFKVHCNNIKHAPLPLIQPLPSVPAPICKACRRQTQWKTCLSNGNGNYGRPFAACNGGGPTYTPAHFYRWYGIPSPTLPSQPAFPPQHYYPIPIPIQTQPPSSLQRARNSRSCVAANCTSQRAAGACTQPAGNMCATHCKSLGGCPVCAHTVAPTRTPIPNPNLPPFTQYPSSPPHSQATTSFTPARFSPSPSPDSTFASDPVPRANPMLKTQIRPVFTEQKRREVEIQEAARKELQLKKEGQLRAKHNVDICVWIENGADPEETAIQDGFSWPDFLLTPSILADIGLDNVKHFSFYRISTMTWVNIKPGHSLNVASHSTILLRKLDVTDCKDLEQRISSLLDSNTSHPKNSRSTNMWDTLGRQRAAVEAGRVSNMLQGQSGGNRKRQATNSSSPPTKPTVAKKAKKKAKAPSPPSLPERFTASPSPSLMTMTLDLTSLDPVDFVPQLAPSHPRPSSTSTVISVSSSSPSPVPPVVRTWVKLECLSTPLSISSSSSHQSSHSSRSSIDASDKENAVPARYTPKPLGTASWPGDFYVVDIIDFFDKAKQKKRRQGQPIHKLFTAHFNKPWTNSTFYDNRGRWEKASQGARDQALQAGLSQAGLWSAFAAENPLANVKVNTASKQASRQRKKAARVISSDEDDPDDIYE
ncbi:hypothetical protein C8J56DRAFT_1072663 [Mycena floridula]|nr:hypothetical protein C8J56DRAFT_1072663 [Mycena floridula]